jgi:hypothetical protein
MGNRHWALLGIGLFGMALYWGVGSLVQPNSGDEEFKKMLEAMKQVKSFRGSYVMSVSGDQRSEKLWEVDCNRGIVHKQSQDSQTGGNSPLEIREDEYLVGSDQIYTRESDGSWQKSKYTSKLFSASWYCDNVAQGTVRDLLPDALVMLRHAMIGKGDKKTVNGIRCQDWKYAMKSQFSGQQGSVCIGLEDHLPYEMTVDNNARYSYTDYNRPIQFDAPEAVLLPVSSTESSN